MKLHSLFLVLSLAGCAAAQVPVHFTLDAAKPDPIDVVVRTLATEGLTAGPLNREAGTLQTVWQDTGFGYGFVDVRGPDGQMQSVGATIVRRYTIVLVPKQAGVEVTVRADLQKCASGTLDASGGLGQGCQRLDDMVPKHQDELNALGHELEAALHN